MHLAVHQMGFTPAQKQWAQHVAKEKEMLKEQATIVGNHNGSLCMSIAAPRGL